MSRFALICLNLLVVVSVTPIAPIAAETLERAERNCATELLQRARAACLDYLAEQRELAIEARIASTLAGLQAARPAELRALAIRYRDSQAAWRSAVEEICMDEDVLSEQRCRLAAVLARDEEVSESLARAGENLGGPAEPEIFGLDEVDVWIPLELPPGVGTGDEVIGVPLWVPLLP